jgi:hypothetical protein
MTPEQMQEMIAQAVAQALAAQAPKEEAVVSNEEMAKRVKAHNRVLKADIVSRKSKLEKAFDFAQPVAQHSDRATEGTGPRDSTNEYTGPADRRDECFADVMAQACWGIANGSCAQYMWHRMLSDNAYLRLANIQDEAGSARHEQQDESSLNRDYERDMEPNRDMLALQRNYDYHIATAYAYEVNMHAAFTIWEDIQAAKEEAFYERNQGNLDAVYTNKARAPAHDISEGAYTAYLEKRASKSDQDTLKQGQHAMQAARLLRLTLHADES